MEEITPAQVSLDDDGCLYAIDFEDYYHSKQGALAESRYVFLEGNQLPERWIERKGFTIGELGFGAGLNFLTSCAEWLKNTCSDAVLHYLTIEQRPFQKNDLRNILEKWGNYQYLSDELLINYPPLLTGMHRLELFGGRVHLTLCFMAADSALAEWCTPVDCWYLDGFSPARNPSMWSEPLMQQVARLSHSGTTLATFTAASVVRRHLQAAGFQVTKRKGFGRKREMLTAVYIKQTSTPATIMPWYHLPANNRENIQQCDAIVIGGGIAGCQIARALAERGWKVRVLERHGQLATEASGNRAGVLAPKMTAEPGWGERFYRQAFLYTYRQLQRLQQEHPELEWSDCGSIQLNHNEREAKRWQALSERQLPEDFIRLLDVTEASEMAGIALPNGGSYFPSGGWVNPRSFCAALIKHENIQVLTDTAVHSLEHENHRWRVIGEHELSADVVVIANGRDASRLTTGFNLPFMPVRGQSSLVTATTVTSALRTTLGHEGYLIPALDGWHTFGATFERENDSVTLSMVSDQQNLRQLSRHLPMLAAGFNQVNSGHAALRMTTPDRFPYVGPLPDVDFYRHEYVELRNGKTRRAYPAALYTPGLYITAGFGSRGLTTSGLCAAVLAGLINGEPLALEKSLYYKLHPSRFLIRRIRQGHG